MPRRFLTAEDVLRASAAEILVDESTVVTPQAQEAAAARGIAIKTGSGSWKEPPPDRGPDAELAPKRLPNLPEPNADQGAESAAIVTAVGKNRPGVLAAITAKIAEQQGNVNDVSQKVVEGYFHMILTVELTPGTSFDAFKTALECMSSPDDFAVRVMNERIFRYMHRV
ncbi:MAG: ACT domain-containing protein [Planctomycetota bacterium]